MSKVISFETKEPYKAGDVVPEVVAILQKSLEREKAGEIKALALVEIDRADQIHTVSEAPVGGTHLMVAATAYLQHDLMAAGSARDP